MEGLFMQPTNNLPILVSHDTSQVGIKGGRHKTFLFDLFSAHCGAVCAISGIFFVKINSHAWLGWCLNLGFFFLVRLYQRKYTLAEGYKVQRFVFAALQ